MGLAHAHAQAQAGLKARQGVGNMVAVIPRVVAQDWSDVPADGVSVGEIALRGTTVRSRCAATR